VADPFGPVPEIRKHSAKKFVDDHGDTWDETGTIKIGFRDPLVVLSEQDALRDKIREDLDVLGIRDRTEKVEITLADGTKDTVELLPAGPLGADILQFGEPENEAARQEQIQYHLSIDEAVEERKLAVLKQDGKTFTFLARDRSADERLLAVQDAQRAADRKVASSDRFRQSFVQQNIQEIESIRQGRRVSHNEAVYMYNNPAKSRSKYRRVHWFAESVRILFVYPEARTALVKQTWAKITRTVRGWLRALPFARKT